MFSWRFLKWWYLATVTSFVSSEAHRAANIFRVNWCPFSVIVFEITYISIQFFQSTNFRIGVVILHICINLGNSMRQSVGTILDRFHCLVQVYCWKLSITITFNILDCGTASKAVRDSQIACLAVMSDISKQSHLCQLKFVNRNISFLSFRILFLFLGVLLALGNVHYT